MTLSEYIRRRRKAKIQTQKQAAKEIGVTRQTWVHWEHGQAPSTEHLMKLATWMGITLKSITTYLAKD